MNDEITNQIQKIEDEHKVKVIFASEFGSRAYGTHTNSSDFDIRFIFIQSLENYIQIDRPNESIVFQTKQNMEFHGWDLLKAGMLFYKSNPSVYEALFSPIVYKEEGHEIEGLRQLAQHSYSLKSLFHHYYKMVKSNIHSMKAMKNKEILIYRDLKIVIQALRALLAAYYIVDHNRLPPIGFDKLIEDSSFNNHTQQRFSKLLSLKLFNPEKGQSVLSTQEFYEWLGFLQNEYQSLGQFEQITTSRGNKHEINRLIWKILLI